MSKGKKDFIVFIGVVFCLVSAGMFLGGAALKEAGVIDAMPSSLYGFYNSVVKRVSVDSSGRLNINATISGNANLNTLTANTVNATLINLNGSPLTATPSSGNGNSTYQPIQLSNGTSFSSNSNLYYAPSTGLTTMLAGANITGSSYFRRNTFLFLDNCGIELGTDRETYLGVVDPNEAGVQDYMIMRSNKYNEAGYNITGAMLFTPKNLAGSTFFNGYESQNFVLINDEGADSTDFVGVSIGQRKTNDVSVTNYFDFFSFANSTTGTVNATTTEIVPTFRFGPNGNATLASGLSDGSVIVEKDLQVNGNLNATLINLNGSPLTADSVMVYPSSGIALSNGTGWSESIVDNSAKWNMAYGWGNYANHTRMGTNAKTTYYGDSAFGYGASAQGGNSTAIGVYSNAPKGGSISIGQQSVASGLNSIAIGTTANTTDYGGIAIGPYSTAASDKSVAIGMYANATSYGAVSVGPYGLDTGTANEDVRTDPAFMVGNGTSTNNCSNAFTVLKNGNATIGAYLGVTSGGSNNAAACWVGTQLGHCTTNDVTECGCTL